jgi:cytochrome b pre-mRNA-processing protein 3
MDANLREMGAGDLGVGRRVKRMVGALYGRIAAYEAGLDGGGAALEAALQQTVFVAAAPAEAQMAAVREYLLAARDRLAARTAAELAQGAIDFPMLDSTSHEATHSIPPPLVGGG